MIAAKAWVSLVGSLLTVIIPLLVQVSASLPQPWPSLIGAIVALLTAFGVYRVPNKPASSGSPATGPTPWPTD